LFDGKCYFKRSRNGEIDSEHITVFNPLKKTGGIGDFRETVISGNSEIEEDSEKSVEDYIDDEGDFESFY